MRIRVKRLLAVALLLPLGVLACGPAESVPSGGREPAAAPAAPNLLLITLDTTRADALGAYGQERETTPNIDRAARKGVLFEDVTSSHPETLPSHSTIFTGKLPYAHGVRSNSGYLLSEHNVTLAEVLRDQGYRTGAEVAAPVLRSDTQVTQGFDHYRGAESDDAVLKVVHFRDQDGERQERTRTMRIGADIAERGIEFIQADDGRPFFLWLHFFDAHDPHLAPASFNEKIPDSTYHAEVASADFQVGLVLRELRRQGLEDNTLVVITADHGEGLLEHGEPSHSYFLYDTVMRVPLILVGLPQLPTGRRIGSPVRTADIAPTVLELLGQAPLPDSQGVSLLPLVRGDREDLALTGYGEATRFTATFGLPPLRYVRDGPWKYIHKVNPELYNVVEDPAELVNLAARHPDRVAEMRSTLEGMLADAPPPPDDAQAAVDAQMAAQLMALGYMARSATFEVRDERDALALEGDDPSSKAEDIQVVSQTMGFLGRRDFRRALGELEPLLARNPGNPFVMELVAQALMGLERYDEAIGLLREVVAQRPHEIEPRYNLAKALASVGRKEEAASLYGPLIEQMPCDERFRVERSLVLRDLKRHAELMEVLADGVDRCPDQPSNWNNYAWALATLPEDELRDGALAVEIIEAGIARLAEPSAAFRDTLAAAHAESGNFPAAVREGDQLLQQMRSEGAPLEVLLQLEAHLEAYRAGLPVRDPPVPAR